MKGLFLFFNILLITLISQTSFATPINLTSNTKATAQLVAACNISATNINFGNIASTGGTQTLWSSPGNVQVLCNKNASYNIQLNAGVNMSGSYGRQLKGSVSGDLLHYAICPTQSFSGSWSTGQCTAGAWFTGGPFNYPINGTGTGTAQNYPTYGAIPAGFYTPDNYFDTITATINF